MTWGREGERKKDPKEKGVADDLTRTGALMGAIGGALMASTIVMAWVVLNGAQTNVFDLIDQEPLFYFLLIAEMLGVISLGFSVILIRSAAWPHMTKLRWAWSLTGLTLVMLAGFAVGLWQLQADFFASGSQYRYGPAPFLAVFGIIFSIMGAIMYLIDSRKAVQQNVARSGFRPRRQNEFQEMATTPQVYQAVSECPQCGEDVSDDMVVCPCCSAVLTGDANEEDMEQVR